MKESFLVVIPARAGSKRLRNKNIRLFAGKPLIAWTIELVSKINGQHNVIVSTEDKNIAKIAKEYGASVPFLRPSELAADNISAVEVMKHAISKLKFKGIVLLLQPTSPLRSLEDINKGISLIKKNKTAVISVVKYIHNSNLTTFSKPGERFIPISIDNKDLYVPNGAIYIADSEWLLKNNSFYTQDVTTFEMPQLRSIDIDYEYQFLIAENIFKESKSEK